MAQQINLTQIDTVPPSGYSINLGSESTPIETIYTTNLVVTNITGITSTTITITGGTGIEVTGSYPDFTITNTASGETITITGGTNIAINGSYPNFGIEFTGTTGSGIPAGNDREVQFNNGGSFGSSTGFTFNSGNILNINGQLSNGLGTNASGNYSHAEGFGTNASGLTSHAEGTGSVANGIASHAEGNSTRAIGDGSHSEGIQTFSIGNYSHSEGFTTTGTGISSHSEGSTTIASGIASHAEGVLTKSIGGGSHSEGLGTIAEHDYQHVSGKYNTTGETSSNTLFVIGNGENDQLRSDIFVVTTTDVTIKSLSGTTGTTRMVESTSGGTLTATKEIITAYIENPNIISGLTDDNNWDNNNDFIGTGITGTYQGQNYYDGSYYYSAVDDDVWIRLNKKRPPYKVYTALLTQSGGDSPVTNNGGILDIGVTYEIIYNSLGMDFTNVGAPNNEVGTYFVATGATPNSWGADVGIEEILAWNEGAPIVTVLENTIGNIWFTYDVVGSYFVKSNGLFTTGKTFLICTGLVPPSGDAPVSIQFSKSYSNQNELSLVVYNNGYGGIDGQLELYPASIEIRVYN